MAYLKQKPGSLEEVIANKQAQYQEPAYQKKFDEAVKENMGGIGSMTPKEKQVFFNKLDTVKEEWQPSTGKHADEQLMKDFMDNGGKVEKVPENKRAYNGNRIKPHLANKKNLDRQKAMTEETELQEKDGANTSSKKGSVWKAAMKARMKKNYMKKAEHEPKGNDIEETVSKFTDQQIKQAYGIANDPRYKGGNYSGAVAAIEKIAKGLSSDPAVANVLKRTNEDKEVQETKDAPKKDVIGKDKSEPEVNLETIENTIRNIWNKAANETTERPDSKLYPTRSEGTFPPSAKDNKKDGKEGTSAKDPAAQDKQILTLQGQINILKTKLENEKNKVIKPVANKETGEVPLTVGIAQKLLRDKAEKKELTLPKNEAVSPFKLKYETLRAKIKEKAEKEKNAKKKGEPARGRTMTGEPASKIETDPQINYNT
jgi:hypothetical protein